MREIAPVSAAEIAVNGLPDPEDLRFAIEMAVERKDVRAAIGAAKWADVVATAARLALEETAKARPYAVEALRGRWGYAKVAGPNPGSGGDQKSNDARSFDLDGLTPKQRERWRQLHSLTADEFQAAVEAEREAWPTFKALLIAARKATVGAERAAYDIDPTYEAPVRRGDFRQVLQDIEPGSVSLVLTDPPYSFDAIDLYGDMAAAAARWLRPGGSLVTMCGHAQLPDVFDAIRPHLRYWWTLALENTLPQRIPGKFVIAGWKPMIWFTNGNRDPKRLFHDRLRGTPPDRSKHKWAQSVDVIWPIVESLTLPGDLVVDPFAGTASWGRSILAMQRRWIGADIGGAVIS